MCPSWVWIWGSDLPFLSRSRKFAFWDFTSVFLKLAALWKQICHSVWQKKTVKDLLYILDFTEMFHTDRRVNDAVLEAFTVWTNWIVDLNKNTQLCILFCLLLVFSPGTKWGNWHCHPNRKPSSLAGSGRTRSAITPPWSCPCPASASNRSDQQLDC